MVYERNGVAIGVWHLPERKRPVLAWTEDGGNVVHVLAAFTGEDQAKEFDDTMSEFLSGMLLKLEYEEVT